MKNVLVVINTMGRAGAEKALISMLRNFDYSKYSVSLLALIDRGELFLDVPKEVKVLNENPSVDPVLGKHGAFYVGCRCMKQIMKNHYLGGFVSYVAKNFVKQIKNRKFQPDKLLWFPLAEATPSIDKEYDLAIAFLEGASTYYVADKVKAKRKVAFVHVNYEKAGYDKNFDLRFYQKMDYICCVSEAVGKALGKDAFPMLSARIRLFPNIVDAHEIRSKAEEGEGFRDDFKGIRLLTVARLHPQKGLDVAIPAFAKLVDMGYRDVKWYVIGDGIEKANLKRLIKKYRLEEQFILLGSYSNPYPFIKQSDIYIQTSRFEGLSLTLQEALILNKTCITTDFDGIPDLLQNGIHALVIPFSETAIIESIKRLLEDRKLCERLAEGTKEVNLDFPNEIVRFYDLMDGIEWGKNK